MRTKPRPRSFPTSHSSTITQTHSHNSKDKQQPKTSSSSWLEVLTHQDRPSLESSRHQTWLMRPSPKNIS